MVLANRIAIIDLGSNTFHLLIVDILEGHPDLIEIFRKRTFVYLSKGGIDVIEEEKIQEGLECIYEFNQYCAEFGVGKIHAVGTSSLRSAKNSHIFLNQVYEQTSIQIEILSGEEEAILIHKGISTFLNHIDAHSLIMDIGGGSVEFISIISGEFQDFASVDLGISVLRSLLKHSDPIKKDELNESMKYIDQSLSGFFKKMISSGPTALIGASGPFEIINSMCGGSDVNDIIEISREEVISIADKVISSTLSERSMLKGMPLDRADLSLESMILIKYVLDKLPTIAKMIVSPYALKEGVIAEQYF